MGGPQLSKSARKAMAKELQTDINRLCIYKASKKHAERPTKRSLQKQWKKKHQKNKTHTSKQAKNMLNRKKKKKSQAARRRTAQTGSQSSAKTVWGGARWGTRWVESFEAGSAPFFLCCFFPVFFFFFSVFLFLFCFCFCFRVFFCCLVCFSVCFVWFSFGFPLDLLGFGFVVVVLVFFVAILFLCRFCFKKVVKAGWFWLCFCCLSKAFGGLRELFLAPSRFYSRLLLGGVMFIEKTTEDLPCLVRSGVRFLFKCERY